MLIVTLNDVTYDITEWVPHGVGALSPRVHLLSHTSDPRHSGRGRVYSRLDVTMRVRRKLQFWIWNFWLPLFQFTLLSFASMLVEITWLDARLSITLTMLVTKARRSFILLALPLTLRCVPQVGYRFSMDEVLPRISYSTVCDKYYLLCIIISSALTMQAMVVAWRTQADPHSYNSLSNNLQLPAEGQASQRYYMLICGGAWIALNLALPCAAVALRASQKAVEASVWWTEAKDTVLWVGPVGPGAGSVARAALQAAFDDAYTVRCKELGLHRSTTRSTIASFATVSLSSLRFGSIAEEPKEQAPPAEDGSEGESVVSGNLLGKRPPKRVQVVDLRVMTPAELQALRASGTFRYALPASRSAFVLVEFDSAAQAAEAHAQLQEACDTDAARAALASSSVHMGESFGDHGAAAAPADGQPAPSPHPVQPSPRTPRSRRLPGGGARTLQDVARAWRPTDSRRVVVEPALPEFVHLLAAAELARGAAGAASASLRALARAWWAPRRSSNAAVVDAKTSSRLAAMVNARRPSSGGADGAASAYDAKEEAAGAGGAPALPHVSLDGLGATSRTSSSALNGADAALEGVAETGGAPDAERGVSKPLVSALRKR